MSHFHSLSNIHRDLFCTFSYSSTSMPPRGPKRCFSKTVTSDLYLRPLSCSQCCGLQGRTSSALELSSLLPLSEDGACSHPACSPFIRLRSERSCLSLLPYTAYDRVFPVCAQGFVEATGAQFCLLTLARCHR